MDRIRMQFGGNINGGAMAQSAFLSFLGAGTRGPTTNAVIVAEN
jgi:hypothetical protein